MNGSSIAGQRTGGRAPLAALPNGSPSKAVKHGKAGAGKPTPQKPTPKQRPAPPSGRKRGPRPAAPQQTTSTPKQDRSGGRRLRPNTPGGGGSPAVDTKAPPTVSALVRRYAGDGTAAVPRRRAGPAGSRPPQGSSAISATVQAAGTAATQRPQVPNLQLQLQGGSGPVKPQAQPQQAASSSGGKGAAAEQPSLSVGSRKPPLQANGSVQNGGGSSYHSSTGNPAKSGVSGSKGDVSSSGNGGSINKTSDAGGGRAPPVSAAEVRARAAGIEAFKAFQQRQLELRRRRRSAAGPPARPAMAPVPEGRLLLTARAELAAADVEVAGPAPGQGFGAPPSHAGGLPASGGAPPSAKPYTNAPASPSASSVHANPLFDGEAPATLQGGFAGPGARLLSSVLLRHGADAADAEDAAMAAAAGWAAEAAVCSNPVSPRCPPSVAGTCASEWAGADVQLPAGSYRPPGATALSPGATAFRPAAGHALKGGDPQAALLRAFLTTTAELRDRMRSLEEQNEAIAGFLVSGDASRLSTPARPCRRRHGYHGAPSEIGYDRAARRLGQALQGAAGSAYSMRRSASRGSYRSVCDGYASEVSGFSAYSTAAGPYVGRYRGPPSAAGSEFDAAFEQGYHYAGSVQSRCCDTAAGSQSGAPAAAAPGAGIAAAAAAKMATVDSRRRRRGDSSRGVASGAASPAASTASNRARWQ